MTNDVQEEHNHVQCTSYDVTMYMKHMITYIMYTMYIMYIMYIMYMLSEHLGHLLSTVSLCLLSI